MNSFPTSLEVVLLHLYFWLLDTPLFLHRKQGLGLCLALLSVVHSSKK